MSASTGVPSISLNPARSKNAVWKVSANRCPQPELRRGLDQGAEQLGADLATAVVRVHSQRADLAEVGPQHVQRAAADQFAADLGHAELLDVLIESDEFLGQQLAAGTRIDVDEGFDGGDVGGPGPSDDDLHEQRP